MSTALTLAVICSNGVNFFTTGTQICVRSGWQIVKFRNESKRKNFFYELHFSRKVDEQSLRENFKA